MNHGLLEKKAEGPKCMRISINANEGALINDRSSAKKGCEVYFKLR